MKRKILTACLLQLFVSIAAYATCSTNEEPSNMSACDYDVVTNRNEAFQDQAKQLPADVYCLALCNNDSITPPTCAITTPASDGCTSSGSYSNVWLLPDLGTDYGPCNTSETTHIELYSLINPSGSPTNTHKAWQMYITDGNNCGQH